MTTLIIENFKLEDHLKEVEITTEQLKEADGSIFTLRHKALKLVEGLTLYLFDSGQATLEYRDHEVETFMWDEELAGIFDNFYIVSAFELFEAMHRKRWESSVNERN